MVCPTCGIEFKPKVVRTTNYCSLSCYTEGSPTRILQSKVPKLLAYENPMIDPRDFHHEHILAQAYLRKALMDLHRDRPEIAGRPKFLAPVGYEDDPETEKQIRQQVDEYVLTQPSGH